MIERTRLVPLAFLGLLGFLVLGGYLSVYFSRNLEQNRQAVTHTREVIDTARTLLAQVQDAETGQQGYIITERPAFLDSYREALGEVPRLSTVLRDLTRDNQSQQQRLDALDTLLKAKMNDLAKGLEASRTQGFETARAVLRSETGKDILEAIRLTIQDVIAEENDLLDGRITRARQSERLTLYSAIVGTMFGLLTIVGAGTFMMRSNASLRAAEHQKADQAQLLQSTLDNIRDGIAAFDAQNRLIAFNQRFFTFTRLPVDLAQAGMSWDAIQAAEASAKVPLLHNWVDPASRRKASFAHVNNGARELDMFLTPTPGGGFLVSCADVTSRMRAEDVARQAQKMEAIGHLTGGIAHDFNNLLQVINTNLDLLAPDVEKKRAIQRLQNAVAGAERGARLTRQLLAFARRQPLEPRVVNLGRLLNDLNDMAQRTLGERIAVETVVAGGIWNVRIDPTQLENALLNLAINARDAMPDGGKLTIEASNAFLDEVYVADYNDLRAGQYVMIAVSDTGTGMSPDVIARVFEPFFTTKAEGHGTGLGLSQAYGFVKQSGGHIRIYSEIGHGTTIKLYLPRTTKALEEIDAIATATAEGGQETVLVVEDDAGVRHAVVDMLTSLGYRVLQADSAEAALSVLSSGTPVDLLFTDVVMPGKLKTPELARHARQLHPAIAILFTSGYTENAIIHHGQLDEGVQLLSKPYRKDDLARKVRAVLKAPREAQVPPVQPIAPREPEAAMRRLRILVVEDELLVRLTTMDMLQELGHEVVDADTGAAALAAFASDPEIEVLLTDVGLPDMSGQTLAEKCRAQRPSLKVVFATGYDSRSVAEGLKTSATLTVLGKPFQTRELRKALAKAMAIENA